MSETRRTIERKGDRGIARRLSSVRRERGFSLMQVADMLPEEFGLSRRELADFEAAVTEIPPPILDELAEIYGRTTEWLINGPVRKRKSY